MYCKLRLGDQIKNYTNLQPYSFILDYMRKKWREMELYSAYPIGLGHISPMDPKFNLQTHTLGLYMKLNRNVNYLSNIPQIYRHINLAAFWAY